MLPVAHTACARMRFLYLYLNEIKFTFPLTTFELETHETASDGFCTLECLIAILPLIDFEKFSNPPRSY